MKVWEVNVGDQTTMIPVRYSAYPEPSFKWYVPRPVLIQVPVCRPVNQCTNFRL